MVEVVDMKKKVGLILLITFPITFYYLSPVIILAGAYEHVVTGSFIVFALLFLVSIVYRRLFCSICPVGYFQDLYALMFRRNKGKLNWLKFIVWFIWLGVLFYLSKGVFYEVDPFYMTWYGISTVDLTGLIVYLIVMVSVFGLTILLGRRGFCHSGCWIAPFMITGSKLGELMKLNQYNLRVDGDCIECKKCNKVCSMDLNVMENKISIGTECILCGKCVEACPVKCLKIGFREMV